MVNISEMFSFLEDNKLTIVPICGRCGGKCHLNCLSEYCDGGRQNEYDLHIHHSGPCPKCKMENLLIHVLRGFANIEIKMKEIEDEFRSGRQRD
jgi:hypothetical protein